MKIANKLRYIGIVADGTTDKEILAKLAKCLIENGCPCEEVLLGQCLAGLMRSFRNHASKTENYAFCGKPAGELRKGIINVLFAAVAEFQSHMSRDLTDSDLLVLNADGEWYLRRQDRYFEQESTLAISSIFLKAVEEFYHKVHNRSQWRNLPMIVPLVLFPSTDILVAAAKMATGTAFDLYGKKAKRIKRELYGVDNLHYLRRGEFEQKALNFIAPGACESIYKHIPESRIFLRTLCWNRGISTS